VTSFKLLGVTLDNKLTFTEHCSNLKKIINRKLYSIKRLFFLCTSVKIHFFKTFILPYFDYCLSLIIYFPSSAYQSLCNCFNPDEEQTTDRAETLPPGIVPSDENTQTDLRKVQPIQGTYSLRGRTIIKSIIPETKFETLTFKHFFPRLLKTFKHFGFTLRKGSFKARVNFFLRENMG